MPATNQTPTRQSTVTETAKTTATNADEYLGMLADEAVKSISHHAESVRLTLRSIRNDVTEALNAMGRGESYAGLTALGSGPIGHQLPADLIKESARLHEALQLANRLGVPDDIVDMAYRGEL